jgi:Fic family protein
MFEPIYTITPKLLADIKRIGIITSELNRCHFSKTDLVKFEKIANEISAHTSTSIEGNPLPLIEVKRILKNHPENVRDSEKEVLNYNEALEFLNERINKKTAKFSLSLVLKIQKLVTKGLIAPHNNGRIRQEPVFVNDPRTGKVVYLPPDHDDVPDLMNGLITFASRNKNILDPLIVAGIFHKQFVIIHPFLDGNGRTARLATKVLLANMGLNTFNLFSFENYYNRNVAKYFEKVGVTGNYYDIQKHLDFTPWLEYFTDGIIDEMLRVKKILERETASPETTLRPHHQMILDYIRDYGFITDRDYAKITDRAKPTRNLDFNKLIELGLIERLGKGKSTYYKLKQE